MPVRPVPAAAVIALAVAVGLTACSRDDTSPETGPTSSPSSESTSPPASPTTSPSTSPAGPASRSATTQALDWRPVPGPVDDLVTRNAGWTLTVTGNGAGWSLEGARSGSGDAPPGWRVSNALLDDDWAVVVLQQKAEEKPSRATVTELATGKSFSVDGRSDVPTTNGGTWALGGGRLLYATVRRGAYCLASADLATRRSTVSWCAPARHGFNAAHATPAGDPVLSFDDRVPACRTEVEVADGAATPFPGVPACKAWEGLVTDDGAVWSVIPRERQVEAAHFTARQGSRTDDLGPGTSDSLVWCAGAAYFTRDPQRQGAPAALMRWSPDAGLTVAYESAKGHAFLEAPRCGGSAITVTARTSAGDEQVSADLG